MNADLVRDVLSALEAAGARYVVFGAVALNLHGLARATEDLDIFVAPTEENIGRVKSALRAVFRDPSIEEIDSRDLLGEYPAVRYAPPEGPFYVDILTRLGEAFRYDDLKAERVELSGITVSVATPRTLFAFASYNAGPANISRMRKEAAKRGLDPDQWFNSVELVTAERIGAETTTYVRNIYKYYVAYRLMIETEEVQKKARTTIEKK